MCVAGKAVHADTSMVLSLCPGNTGKFAWRTELPLELPGIPIKEVHSGHETLLNKIEKRWQAAVDWVEWGNPRLSIRILRLLKTLSFFKLGS